MKKNPYLKPSFEVIFFSSGALCTNPGSDLDDGGNASENDNPPLDVRRYVWDQTGHYIWGPIEDN